jgi:two-component system response regulator YesN
MIIESVSVLEISATDYILQLIAKINRLQCGPSQMVVDQMKKFITENIAENLTIESFVEEFNFSPSYLRAVFKKFTGMTVLEFTTDVRLNKAVSMLQATSFQVNQISLRVGYKNPSYFCSKFYEKYGITPIQYRNRFRT